MGGACWPSEPELNAIRRKVAGMSGRDANEVRIVVSPYRICPLGAHIDHQGGTVSAMTINKAVLLGFVPSSDCQVILQSGQFRGEVKFRVDEEQFPRSAAKLNNSVHANGSSVALEECSWGNYARGAIYALQRTGNDLKKNQTLHCRIRRAFVEKIKAGSKMLFRFLELENMRISDSTKIFFWSPYIIVWAPRRTLVREKQVPFSYKKCQIRSRHYWFHPW